MKMTLLLLGMLLMVGCSASRNIWIERADVPLTEEERKTVAKQEQALMAHVPWVLSGHDQDWDDAIKAAHAAAMQTCIAPRLYERHYDGGWMVDWNDGVWTGRWKYFDAEPCKDGAK